MRRTTLLLTTLVLGLAPASAFAEGSEIGQKVKGPGKACQGNNAENDNVKVCFLDDGEYLYVQDKASDGRSAYGQISGRDDRHCRNPYGKGTWVRCNYRFREGTPVSFRGYTKDNEGRINIKRNETPYTADLA